MFESASLSQKLSRREFRTIERELRTALLFKQLELAEERKRAIILLIAGIDGAGKSPVAQRMLDWLDPRHITTNAFYLPTEQEALYPRMQRYWRGLPAKGQMSILFGSWYHQPLYERIVGGLSEGSFQEEMHRIAAFESMLVNEGYLICKLWLHLPRDERKKRSESGNAPVSESRVREWGDIGKLDYGLARGTVEEMARITSTARAPWTVIPGLDPYYRDTLAGQTLLERLTHQPAAKQEAPPSPTPALNTKDLSGPTVLDRLVLDKEADPVGYKKILKRLQERLHELTQDRSFKQTGLVVVFEGVDAAGKGGCIRRVARALDPRLYKVHSIAAPSDEEMAHPYLWRFWRRIPPLGKLVVFDRSWYGRVLVERVEGLCSEAEWERAYQEIVDFEDQLSKSGLKVVKFWLQIDKDEQLRRFKSREETPFKRFKITAEDWRNRENWDAYQKAAVEMIDRTSTTANPWILVPSQSKKYARIQVLERLISALQVRG